MSISPEVAQISDITPPDPICEPCLAGKQHRGPIRILKGNVVIGEIAVQHRSHRLEQPQDLYSYSTK